MIQVKKYLNELNLRRSEKAKLDSAAKAVRDKERANAREFREKHMEMTEAATKI
jgi:hypothetical protein